MAGRTRVPLSGILCVAPALMRVPFSSQSHTHWWRGVQRLQVKFVQVSAVVPVTSRSAPIWNSCGMLYLEGRGIMGRVCAEAGDTGMP